MLWAIYTFALAGVLASRMAFPLTLSGSPLTLRSVTTPFSSDVDTPAPVTVHCAGNKRGTLPSVFVTVAVKSPSECMLKWFARLPWVMLCTGVTEWFVMCFAFIAFVTIFFCQGAMSFYRFVHPHP